MMQKEHRNTSGSLFITQGDLQDGKTSEEGSEIDVFELLGVDRSVEENDTSEKNRSAERNSSNEENEMEDTEERTGIQHSNDSIKATPEEGIRTEQENVMEEGLRPEYEDIAANTIEGLLTIKYPFSIHRCSACREIFEEPKKLIEHMKRRHSKDFITFKCNLCGKLNGKIKGIAIHYGLCRKKNRPLNPTATTADDIVTPTQTFQLSPNRFAGLQISEADDSTTSSTQPNFQCSEYEASFNSKIGLVQHLRHKHPTLANENRLAAVQKDIEWKREKRKKDRLIDYLRFYVPLKNISLIWRRHHYRRRAAKFRPLLGAQGL
jgi:hypothetical protein